MSLSATELYEAGLSLTATEREELARKLLASVPGCSTPSATEVLPANVSPLFRGLVSGRVSVQPDERGSISGRVIMRDLAAPRPRRSPWAKRGPDSRQ